MENEWELNPKQLRFLQTQAKYVCYWGGRGCGKSLALVLKLIDLLIRYPGNYGLVGRYNYSDLKDSTMRDFFDICPPKYIAPHGYNKQERMVTMFNGSKIIFRGLKDVHKTQVRSLNLGFAALEQAEEIDEGIINELAGCLRRKVKDVDSNMYDQQMFYLCNPGINWIYRTFIQEAKGGETPKGVPHEPWLIAHKRGESMYELIQGSMFDNVSNLGKSFVDDQLSKPESWKKAFVYGEIDENLMSERKVFPVEYVTKQAEYAIQPTRKHGEIEIYRDKANHIYQIGVDPSERAEDSSVIKCIDTQNGEEVASWAGKIQPDLLGHKVVEMAELYNKPRVVLEINGIGLATLTKLKELSYENIYIREEFDQHAKVMLKKLGWRTTHPSKQLLVGNLTELISLSDKEGKTKEPAVKVHDSRTIEEMRTFMYSDKAVNRGMGADEGFHDDRIMALMLACVDIKPTNSDIPIRSDFVIAPKESCDQTDEELLRTENWMGEKPINWLEL
jgi:hypothetical protein